MCQTKGISSKKRRFKVIFSLNTPSLAQGWAIFVASQVIIDVEDQMSQLNAYRAQMTRARKGMVICVTSGNVEDATRKPEYYNDMYIYLKFI